MSTQQPTDPISIEDTYRKAEKMLNDFKNKRITYSDAIEIVLQIESKARIEGAREVLKCLPVRFTDVKVTRSEFGMGDVIFIDRLEEWKKDKLKELSFNNEDNG